MPVSIYGLVDPRTDEICYVGKTIQPLAMRLQQHVWRGRTGRTTHDAGRWIKAVCDAGMTPRIVLLEEVSPDQWRVAERRWTAYCQSVRALTNDIARAGAGGTRSHVARWTPELDARLGKEPDATIADDMGITRKAVSYRRRILGIPASFDRTRNTPPPPMGGHNRLVYSAEIIALLGAMPDYLLAERAGVSKGAIRRERQERAIPSYAARTGNTGHYEPGNFPARWRKERPHDDDDDRTEAAPG